MADDHSSTESTETVTETTTETKADPVVETPVVETKDNPIVETKPEPTPKEIRLTPHDYGNALQKERDKGKRSAAREFLKQFEEFGVTTVEELRSKFASLAKPNTDQTTTETKETEMSTTPTKTEPAVTTTTTATTEDRPALAALERERLRLEREKAEMATQLAKAESDRKAAEHAREVAVAQAKIDRDALSLGIKDVDYARSLFERSLQGKSEEELKTADHKAFFDTLRKDKPYLFGEVTVPVNTGNGSGQGGAGAGAVATANANDTKVNAMKMTRAEREARLRTLKVSRHLHNNG